MAANDASASEVGPENGVVMRVIAGKANGVTGPVTEIAADPTYMDVMVGPGSSFSQPVPRGHAVRLMR